MDELERGRLSLREDFNVKLGKLQQDVFGQIEDFKRSFLENIQNWEEQWRYEREAFLGEITKATEASRQCGELLSVGDNSKDDTLNEQSADTRVTSSHAGENDEQHVSVEVYNDLAERYKSALNEILRLQTERTSQAKPLLAEESKGDASTGDAELLIPVTTTELRVEENDQERPESEDKENCAPQEHSQPDRDIPAPSVLPPQLNQVFMQSQIDDSQPDIISPSQPATRFFTTPTRKRYREGTPTPLNENDEDTSDDHSTVFETPHHDTFLEIPMETFSPTERAILGPDYSQLKLQERAKSFNFDDPQPARTDQEIFARPALPQNSTAIPQSAQPPSDELHPSSSPIGLANIPGVAESYDLDEVFSSGRSRKRRRYLEKATSSQLQPNSSQLQAPDSSQTLPAASGLETAATPKRTTKTPVKKKSIRPPAGIASDPVTLSSSPPVIVKREEPSQALVQTPMAPPKLPLARPNASGVRNKIGGGRAALQPISANAMNIAEPILEITECSPNTLELTPGQADQATLKGTVRSKKFLTPTASSVKNRIKSASGSAHKTPASAPAKTVQSKLQLSDFKVNSTANPDGLDFAYADTVRRKADKSCLPGCTRDCCFGAFQALARAGLEIPKAKNTLRWSSQDSTNTQARDMDEETRLLTDYLGPPADLASMNPQQRSALLIQAKADQLSRVYGKHKQQFERHHTPPGFWRTDMPTTQEAEEDRQLAREIEERRVAERLREAHRTGGRYSLR